MELGLETYSSSMMTNDYLLSLLHKLKSSDKNEQDYVLEYFSIILLDEFAKLKDSPLQKILLNSLIVRLNLATLDSSNLHKAQFTTTLFGNRV